ncbi:MAG: threonine synthase [Clostridia bacterium]|nr:threonine synthase [Clostridia bacterium]
MLYTSTRDNAVRVTAAEAITRGISADGGLFVPVEIPQVDAAFLASLCEKSYVERAVSVLKLFLDEFGEDELRAYAEGAYLGGKYSSGATVPLVSPDARHNILELWHGPTCAFKDMALQMLPYLLTGSAKKIGNDKKIVILVATSGDTGKAALEGFRDVPGTGILVFYPADGVSPMQKLQMTTQEGKNVGVCAIRGNFDDAQTGVKKIFTDERVKQTLAERGFAFSSANSINWGRLAPQIVYYFSAYADMVNAGKVRLGEKIDVTVPTGNFGNILAAYYAKRMGMPVNKLICASNANNVLTDFINTGVYDRNRKFYTTISPSMDILISSNLERLLYMLSDGDDAYVRGLFARLSAEGKYDVGERVADLVRESFAAGFCSDEETKRTIGALFAADGYLCDTHTGVAVAVYDGYVKKTGDGTPNVIASTASPYKFSAAVLEAVSGKKNDDGDEFAAVDELTRVTGVEAPAQLKTLRGKTPRFRDICTQGEMEAQVYRMLDGLAD